MDLFAKTSGQLGSEELCEVQARWIEQEAVRELKKHGLKAERGKLVYEFSDPREKIYEYGFDRAALFEFLQNLVREVESGSRAQYAAGAAALLQIVVWPELKKKDPSWALTSALITLTGYFPPPPGLGLARTPLEQLLARQRPEAETGRRVRKGASEGGAVGRRLHEERKRSWQKKAEQIWETQPELSKRSTARIIATATDDSEETIRKGISKPV